MTTIVFDSDLTGHHLEYIHHLYTAAINDTQNKYIFIVNKDFEKVKNKIIWSESNNVSFITLNANQQKKCDNGKLLLAAWYKSLIIREYTKKYKANQIWLIMFMQLMPFLPLILNNKIRITGILYGIYLFEKERMNRLRILLEFIRYKIIVSNKSIKKVLVLNNYLGVDFLNKRYKTNKFKYIPDPVPFIDNNKLKNIRIDLGVRDNELVFLHFGGLCRRKGTLDIMQAINNMDSEKLNRKVFIFAGKISDDIKEEFYNLKMANDFKCKIIVFDEFCSYEFINNLCYSCNCILIPYSNVNQSSGVIGYAGYFNKPVISPSEGLLGRLVNENAMGLCIPEITSTNLVKAILTPLPMVNNSKYQETHSIQDFINAWY